MLTVIILVIVIFHDLHRQQFRRLTRTEQRELKRLLVKLRGEEPTGAAGR